MCVCWGMRWLAMGWFGVGRVSESGSLVSEFVFSPLR